MKGIRLKKATSRINLQFVQDSKKISRPAVQHPSTIITEIREWELTLTTSFRRERHDCVEGNIAEEFFPETLTSPASITYPRAA